MLQVSDLVVDYGHVLALRGISLSVEQGEIVALIGSNGAGKSTTLRAISGVVPSISGRVIFDGQDITNRPSHEIVRLGLAHVPEGRQVFANQTVANNLLLGAYSSIRRDRAGAQARLERELERFPVLRERRQQLAGVLSGGEQQMLAISRGLMARPTMLVLDEPSMGLAPLIVRQIARTIRELNGEGVTILLVEQMALVALVLAHRAYVLQNGEVRLSGGSKDLLKNPKVVQSYLGGARGA